jgi:hypothetical protein
MSSTFKAAAKAAEEFNQSNENSGGTRWRSWLRHCATSRKVAGSILDDVIEIFH